MSMTLWRSLRRWEPVPGKQSEGGRRKLHVANPADDGVPPMRARGSSTIPLLLHSKNRVRRVAVTVVPSSRMG